ncbi:MAG: hypothetical protein JWN31_596 [Frankiales bacterium]|nr:hypothetical protein [Frankiales bacterium]
MTRPNELDDPQPDPTVLWRWVWLSVRPVLGYLVIALGLVLVLAAYLGVSREVLVAKQLPYLVSGGLFGLAAVTLGSRLLLSEDLRRDAARLDRLEQAVSELHSVLLSRPDADEAEARPARTAALIALKDGDRFHRPDCALVQGKDTVRKVTTAAQRKGLSACPMCQPLAAGV